MWKISSKTKWIALFLFVFYLCCAPSKKSAPTYPSLFDSDIPIISVGNDDEIRNTGNYETLGAYTVDHNENIYITDNLHLGVDKFDKKGNYQLSFGGVNTDAVKYPGWNATFTVDSKENLIAYSNLNKKFLRFSKEGTKFKEYELHPDLKRFEIKRIKTGKDDILIILGISREHESRLYTTDLETGRYTFIHSDNKRTLPGITDIYPDYATDDAGNIYITDTTDYRVYKYTSQGRRVDTLFREVEKNELEKRDGYFLTKPGRIQKLQGWEETWKNLEKSSRNLPSIFGINIDGNRLYVWTSDRGREKKFRVDIYDLDFKPIGSSSCYNNLSRNMVTIKAGKIYLPNIGSEDKDLKNAVGRFGYFNFPHKIEIFKRG